MYIYIYFFFYFKKINCVGPFSFQMLRDMKGTFFSYFLKMDIVYLKNKLKTLNQMLQQLDETWMIIAQMMTIIFFMFRNKDPLGLYSSQ